MDTNKASNRFELDPNLKAYVLEVSRPSSDDVRMNLSKLCEDLGIEVFNFDFTDKHISGAIARDKNNETWKIFVRASDSPRRKRFTVAHELGHYFSYVNNSKSKEYIDNADDGVIKDYAIMLRSDVMEQPQHKEAELEANEIAAELLMPETAVSDFFKQGKTVEEMADVFVVSESAMTVRLLSLGYKMMEQPAERQACEQVEPANP